MLLKRLLIGVCVCVQGGLSAGSIVTYKLLIVGNVFTGGRQTGEPDQKVRVTVLLVRAITQSPHSQSAAVKGSPISPPNANANSKRRNKANKTQESGSVAGEI